MASRTQPAPPAAAPPGQPSHRWGPVRFVLVLAIAGIVVMWGYVMYLAVGPGRQPPVDRLEDPTFAPAAQARCDAALDALALLPDAAETATSTERAEVIEQANTVLAAMLTDLLALAPVGKEGDMVAAWVADWRTYLGDRAAYADAIRTDPAAPFLVSAKDNDQVTEFIDGFAADNRMPACGVPLDV